MLRGNLSTRPFYNDRLVAVVIGLIALVAVGLTALNVTEILSLSSRRAAVQARLDGMRAEAEAIRARAAAEERTVGPADLSRLASSTREANTLIAARTFSWTTLLGLLEETLPLDVRLVQVAPDFEEDRLILSLSIVAREYADADAFIDALDATGAFARVAPSSTDFQDNGTVAVLLTAEYSEPGPSAAAHSGAAPLEAALRRSSSTAPSPAPPGPSRDRSAR
jgi:hypothetical protein